MSGRTNITLSFPHGTMLLFLTCHFTIHSVTHLLLVYHTLTRKTSLFKILISKKAIGKINFLSSSTSKCPTFQTILSVSGGHDEIFSSTCPTEANSVGGISVDTDVELLKKLFPDSPITSYSPIANPIQRISGILFKPSAAFFTSSKDTSRAVSACIIFS